ncbi:MAG: glycogen/starch synthase [Marinilabiliaceae bacterium]|nr:glycogen/starch synthase [Marinilabiliaceae bacterium]
MVKTKILYVSQEVMPYFPENEMSFVSRFLPQFIQEKGKEIRTFMPRFGLISERRYQLHEVIRLSGMNIIINESDHPLIIKVASIQQARLQIYFIENEEYFHRKFTFYDEDGNFFEDNDERALFYAKGVVETVRKLRWAPDIVHCHGWFSALTPILIKTVMNEDPYFSKSKIVFSVYNDDFKDTLELKLKNKIKKLGVGDKDLKLLEDPNYENVVKSAIQFSDGIIKGSKEINPELEKYIIESKKPFLENYDMDNYIETINDFYNLLLTPPTDD